MTQYEAYIFFLCLIVFILLTTLSVVCITIIATLSLRLIRSGYCLTKISDTEYHAYTFPIAYLESAAQTGAEIIAYKTLLIKTDDWDATLSYEGYAKVKSLSSLGVSSDPNCIPYSIDISTWHK